MAVPTHYAEYHPSEVKLELKYGNQTLASSHRAVRLEEFHQEYDFLPVYYFPKEDVQMELFTPNKHETHCPIKGEASYWDYKSKDKSLENAAWAYQTPKKGAEEIDGLMAFDLNKGFTLYKNGTKVLKQGFNKKKA